MTSHAIQTIVASESDYEKGYQQVDVQSPAPLTPAMADKHRALQCTVYNETDFTVFPTQFYFDSGEQGDVAPTKIDPFSTMTFNVCNKTPSVLTGVTGGLGFSLVFDQNLTYHFGLGFTNPQSGPYTAGCVQDPSQSLQPAALAEAAYNASDKYGGNFYTMDSWTTKTKDGRAIRLKLAVDATPGQLPVYKITENRFYI